MTISLSENGVVKFGDTECNLIEYRGNSATSDLLGKGTIEYYMCDTVDHCEHNVGGIAIEDMSKYKHCKYYSLYLGTKVYLYYPYKHRYIECCATIDEVESLSVNTIVGEMYERCEEMYLADNVERIDFKGKIIFKPCSYTFKVRSNEIVIPATLRLKDDDGSVIANSKVEVNGKTIGKYSTVQYDYYQVDGVLIQVPVGIDISQFIEYKKAENNV